MSKLVLFISIILLNGCSHIPETIRRAPLQDIQIQDTKKGFSEYQYKTVRWGGTIIDVVNNPRKSSCSRFLAQTIDYTALPKNVRLTYG